MIDEKAGWTRYPPTLTSKWAVQWWHAVAHLARLNETERPVSLGFLAWDGTSWQGEVAEREGFEPSIRF